MEDTLITYKTAVLAKEKGFILDNNPDSFTVYTSNEKTSLLSRLKSSYPNYIKDYFEEECFRNYYCFPTQSLLQKWLREVHGIHIEILLSDESPYTQFYYRVMKVGQYFSLSHDGFYRDSYEEVFEEGLFQALKLI